MLSSAFYDYSDTYFVVKGINASKGKLSTSMTNNFSRLRPTMTTILKHALS